MWCSHPNGAPVYCMCRKLCTFIAYVVYLSLVGEYCYGTMMGDDRPLILESYQINSSMYACMGR